MKLVRFASTLYSGILLALFLFPPWMEQTPYPALQRHWMQLDPAVSSLGHHWRFRPPYYWGYKTHDCTDSNGINMECGESVWVPNPRAAVDHRMFEYEAIVGLVLTIFTTLLVDAVGRNFPGANSSIRSLAS